jgi:Pyruvate/2-oxoacid:ferredoxin oxidoreductase delta subunit
MTLVDRFIEVFDVWEEARPYLALLVDEDEMELVVAIAGQAVTAEEAAERLGLGLEETAGRLERAYRRHVVDKQLAGDVATYTAGSLWGRLDHVAKYENWDDIPSADRTRINRRFLDAFIARHRASVERKMQGLEAENALPNDTVLLLHEAEEMVDAATHIVVQPCDCRRLGQHCDWPVETCIWFDDGALECLDRGHGRRLTHQEAKDLLRWVDRQGLMHTGDSDWQTRGLHAICNCCACDCYPFLAARELGSQGVWPKSRYVAVHDRERCTVCGVCVTRCHFGAFYLDGTSVEIDGRARDNVQFDPTRCWGCGLCANTCPADAIAMHRLEAETT